MQNRILVLLGATTLSLSPGSASAYDCTIGGEQVVTRAAMELASQTPDPDTGQDFVWFEGVTSRSAEDEQNCPGWVRIEAWIVGSPQGALARQSGRYVGIGDQNISDLASVFIQGSEAITFQGESRHWFIHNGWFGDPWTHIADHHPTVTAPGVSNPPPPPGEEEEICPDCSPLIFDLGRDGIHLTSASDGVLFDINADGRLELVAWTQPGSDDAWLAYDRNGNGRIDDGSELLGNRTPVYPGMSITSANGFEALKFMERPEYGISTVDMMIDERDAVFSRLLLWTDANHDGVSETSELRKVSETGVVAIDTSYVERNRRDQFGNQFRLRGRSQLRDERGKIKEVAVWDIWLQAHDR